MARAEARAENDTPEAGAPAFETASTPFGAPETSVNISE